VKATNQGLRASKSPYVVLMNNDTTAEAQWLEKLRKPLLAGYGISGPLTTAWGSWQGRYKTNGLEFADVPATWQLAFFCTMIRREVLDQVGLLDEGFGVGLGDDDDYCNRARAAGFKLAIVQNLKIPHRHRSTFKTIYTQPQIHSMQVAAVGRLREKGVTI
jgi:GT2 family glycosyltransferase